MLRAEVTTPPDRQAERSTTEPSQFTSLNRGAAEEGMYLLTSAPCFGGRVWISPRLLSNLASGRNVLVIEGSTREALLEAGWVTEVTSTFVRATDPLRDHYAAICPNQA